MSHLKTLLTLALISYLAYAPKALAVETPKPSNVPDEQQPVHILADRLEVDEGKGKSIYSGHVIITQGSMTLTGETITVIHPNNQVQTIVSVGKPSTFKRFNPTDQAWLKGHANQIDYHAIKNTVLLQGNAQVEQPGDHIISGPQLFYDMAQQTLKAQSTAQEKQRISVTINPASAPEGSAKPPATQTPQP
ncbi:lipopolysaccharide transport periplasmic protein LptA [Thiomicrorhabdus aquaedulcis]|uniref:lipopolysaccharide transport periplasmic protein LptA n=1 Tax=Thiomicrorhabdus aquaedulcis TaxID=2211106 RepID=UPI000FD6CE37|nr:lipopolysaccharide transport periplasmic protein LptA [Thiomicrorhabdus aquaedulcis]